MTVARFLSEELPTARELPMPPWLFAVIALVLFAFALGVTWSFRGTAQKYARPDLRSDWSGRVLECCDERKCGFRSLVQIRPGGGQSVEAAVRVCVPHHCADVVVACEPVDREIDTSPPVVIVGDRKGASARVGQCGDLDRLLVETGPVVVRAGTADRCR